MRLEPPSKFVPRRSHLAPWLAAGLCLLGGWAYWPTLTEVAASWTENPDYTHGFFVVPIAAWLYWQRRKDLGTPAPPRGVSHFAAGLAAVVAVQGLRFAAARFYLPEIDSWTIPLWIGAGVVGLFGWSVARLAWPSLAFLWFGCPLPATLEVALGTPLQRLAAHLSGFVLQLFGQPAVVEGTTILLGEQILDVERACSGLRMFFGIAALAVACVALIRPPRWKAFCLLLATFPVAVAANVVRIAVTGLLFQFVSGEAGRKFSHDYAGLLMIPLAVTMFLAIAALLTVVEQAGSSGRRRWPVAAAVGTATLLILGLAGWQFARRQQGVAADALLARINGFEKQEKWDEAIRYLDRYATAHADDAEALARLALTAADHGPNLATQRESIRLLSTAWAKLPQRTELGIHALRKAVQLHMPEQAQQLGRRLLQSDLSSDQRRDAVQLIADSWLTTPSSASPPEALAAIRLAAELATPEPRHVAALARLLVDQRSETGRAQRWAEAEAALDRLIADRPNDPDAWLARSVHRRRAAASLRQPVPPPAEHDLDQAIKLAAEQSGPAASRALQAGAVRALSQGQVAEARRLLEQATAADPTDYRIYLNLAQVIEGAGGPTALTEAIEVLRRGVAAVPGKEASLVLPLASALAEAGKTEEARQTLQPIEEVLPLIVGPRRGEIALGLALVQAKLERREEGAETALRKLFDRLDGDNVRAALAANPHLAQQASEATGRLQLELGRYDDAIDALDDALRLKPNDAGLRAAYAAAALRAGDLDAAEAAYEQLAAAQPTRGDLKLNLCGAMLARQLSLPQSRRSWSRLETLLDQADAAGAGRERTAMLRAQMQAARGDRAAALETVNGALSELPDSPSLLRVRTLLLDELGRGKEAADAAREFAEQAPTPLESLALAAQLEGGATGLGPSFALLQEYAQNAEGAERVNAALVVAGLQLRQGRNDDALATLAEANKRGVPDLRLLSLQGSVESALGEWPAVEQTVRQMRQVEGEQGAGWRALEARRLLARSGTDDDPSMTQARQLIAELAELRPRWSQTRFLQGESLRVGGRLDAALDAYREAWRRDSSELLTGLRLLETYAALGRSAAAQQFAPEVMHLVPRSTELFDRALPFLTQRGDREEALRLARTWAAASPRDAGTQLRHGRAALAVLLAGDEGENPEELTDEARAAFSSAVATAPDDLRTWFSAVEFELRGGDGPAAALPIMERLAGEAKLSPLARALALSSLYEALGRPQDAARYVGESVRAARRDLTADGAVEALAKSAAYYAIASPRLAELLAREAIAADPEYAGATLALIAALTEQDRPAAREEATALLQQLPGRGLFALREPVMLAAARLAVVSDQPQQWRASIEELEDASAASRPARRLLARLYERTDRTASALETWRDLTSGADSQLADVEGLLKFWQRRLAAGAGDGAGDQDAAASLAEQALARLQAVPELAPMWLRWKIRTATAQQRGDVTTTLGQWVEEALAQGGAGEGGDAVSLRFGRLMREVADADEFAAAARLAAEPPDGVAPQDAAATLCGTLIMSLAGRDVSRDRLAIADAAIDDVAKNWAQDAQLQQGVGDYYLLTGRGPQSTEHYRRALELQPDNLNALNNWALALSCDPAAIDEAKRLAARLAEMPGSGPSQLDSRGFVLLMGGEAEEALKLFKQASQSAPADPSQLLHQAVALDRLQQLEASRQRLIEALTLGIEKMPLLSCERRLLEELLAKAERRAAGTVQQRSSVPLKALPVAVSQESVP